MSASSLSRVVHGDRHPRQRHDREDRHVEGWIVVPMPGPVRLDNRAETARARGDGVHRPGIGARQTPGEPDSDCHGEAREDDRPWPPQAPSHARAELRPFGRHLSTERARASRCTHTSAKRAAPTARGGRHGQERRSHTTTSARGAGEDRWRRCRRPRPASARSTPTCSTRTSLRPCPSHARGPGNAPLRG